MLGVVEHVRRGLVDRRRARVGRPGRARRRSGSAWSRTSSRRRALLMRSPSRSGVRTRRNREPRYGARRWGGNGCRHTASSGDGAAHPRRSRPRRRRILGGRPPDAGSPAGLAGHRGGGGIAPGGSTIVPVAVDGLGAEQPPRARLDERPEHPPHRLQRQHDRDARCRTGSSPAAPRTAGGRRARRLPEREEQEGVQQVDVHRGGAEGREPVRPAGASARGRRRRAASRASSSTSRMAPGPRLVVADRHVRLVVEHEAAQLEVAPRLDRERHEHEHAAEEGDRAGAPAPGHRATAGRASGR